jgi:hypothetical protein
MTAERNCPKCGAALLSTGVCEACFLKETRANAIGLVVFGFIAAGGLCITVPRDMHLPWFGTIAVCASPVLFFLILSRMYANQRHRAAALRRQVELLPDSPYPRGGMCPVCQSPTTATGECLTCGRRAYWPKVQPWVGVSAVVGLSTSVVAQSPVPMQYAFAFVFVGGLLMAGIVALQCERELRQRLR